MNRTEQNRSSDLNSKIFLSFIREIYEKCVKEKGFAYQVRSIRSIFNGRRKIR